jgi:membrane-associated phospholipid phosphatase
MRRGIPTALATRLDPAGRYGLRLTLFGVAVVLVAAPFSALLFQVLAGGPMTRLDGDLADSLNRFVHERDGWVGVLEAVSALGWPPVLWAVALVSVGWAWLRGARRLAVFLVATTAGAAVLSTVLKVLVDRPRPDVDHPVIEAFGGSFPSGHALGSTVVYGAVVLAFLPLVPRAWRHTVVALTAVAVVAVGASRLLLGVHFLSDVVAGHVLGVAWLVGSTAIFEVWRLERGRRAARPLDEGVEPEELARRRS